MISAGLLLISATVVLFLLPVFVNAELNPPADGGTSSSSGSNLETFATWVGIISGISGIVSTIIGLMSKTRPPEHDHRDDRQSL